jgi:hypothetical protein
VLDTYEHEPDSRRHSFVLLDSAPEDLSLPVRRQAQQLGICTLGIPFELDN